MMLWSFWYNIYSLLVCISHYRLRPLVKWWYFYISYKKKIDKLLTNELWISRRRIARTKKSRSAQRTNELSVENLQQTERKGTISRLDEVSLSESKHSWLLIRSFREAESITFSAIIKRKISLKQKMMPFRKKTIAHMFNCMKDVCVEQLFHSKFLYEKIRRGWVHNFTKADPSWAYVIENCLLVFMPNLLVLVANEQQALRENALHLPFLWAHVTE